jgi:CheY-like chemotaxis protein/HPt (histidine-containing phosphotransfer) domain-containing protein
MKNDLTKTADFDAYEARHRMEDQLKTNELSAFAPAPGLSESAGKPGQIRILVAEDNTVDRIVAKSILNKLDYYADFVSNGREAVQIMGEKHYDLVLMDCVMPVMDGFEAAAMIRNPESPALDHQTPIIAMTAGFIEGHEAKYLAAGMNDYIAKPVTLPKLAATVTKLVALHSGNAGKNEGTAIFDRQELTERLLHDENLLHDVINDFLQNLPRQLEDLKASIDTPILAHIIKDSAMAIGANELYPLAMKIEDAAKNHDREEAARLMPQLEEAAVRLIALLKNEAQNTIA